MFIKKKHILVIIFSSVIISVALVSTLIGYTLYIQWKEDSLALKYRSSIYKLTAGLFRNEVALSNVRIMTEGEDQQSGRIFLEGNLKNNTNKTITSLLIEVYFDEPDGTVVYKNWFHPLGEAHLGGPSIFFGAHPANNVLLPGEDISFRHHFPNCPRKLSEELFRKTKFARRDEKGGVTMRYSIEGLSVL
jgi:hypothetical protein